MFGLGENMCLVQVWSSNYHEVQEDARYKTLLLFEFIQTRLIIQDSDQQTTT